MTTAEIFVAREQFRGSQVEDMRRKLGDVGVASARILVPGLADIELVLDDIAYYGTDASVEAVDAFVEDHPHVTQ